MKIEFSVKNRRQKGYNMPLASILGLCSEFFGVTVEDIQSKSRKQEIVKARFCAMYLARNFSSLTLLQIGKDIGGRDHTTVIHALQMVDNALTTKDLWLYHDIKEIIEMAVLMIDYKPTKNCLNCVVEIESRPLIQTIKTIYKPLRANY